MKNQTTKPSDSPQSSPSQYNYPHNFRTAYGPKLKISTTFTGLGRTKQSHKNECDITQIMARYLRTGVIDFTAKNEARYADCTGWDFQSAMERVASAKTMFEEMPAQLRDRFENSPGKFLDFINDPKNLEEARELGLAKRKPPEATPVATPPSKAAPMDRTAVRKAAQEAGDRKAGDDPDHLPT